jgi:predicted phosphodiesterase
LRDQLLLVGQKPEVKFLVVSSDVIYPAGAMKDYERKFYLPFKGFHKPVYAVPGNHDWYDALESFAANFLEPRAARAALRARRAVDHKLTTTTEARVDGMVAEAERLRREYRVRAAGQRAPYFDISADRFSLVVVDTGIRRRVDDDQMRWLEQALGRGRGKFTMVILGHPLYAAGRYQGADDEEFARVHDLLKAHAVDVVMAGDTHDFEYYKEEPGGGGRPMYHFVNGGGGAYLSIGTALAWPKRPPATECGFYPRADALRAKLEAGTPAWKRPLWLWVKHFAAWPSSPETLSAAFDYDRAPFFQSFMEARVEGSANRVRFWLYGANGRLRWRDLYVHGERLPNGQNENDLVEFSFPLRALSH